MNKLQKCMTNIKGDKTSYNFYSSNNSLNIVVDESSLHELRGTYTYLSMLLHKKSFANNGAVKKGGKTSFYPVHKCRWKDGFSACEGFILSSFIQRNAY